MIITPSESKFKLGRPGNGLFKYLGLRAKTRPNKYKRYAILNFIKKDLSNIIGEFLKLPYESYEEKRPKHEPNDSYFYLARQIAKCMMKFDALNLDVYPVKT